MSRVFLTLVLAVIGMMFLATDTLHAQDDCERVLQGNPLSPCKVLDYLDGVQPPELRVEVRKDEQQVSHCQPVVYFPLSEPLDKSLLSNPDHFNAVSLYIGSSERQVQASNVVWARDGTHKVITDKGIVFPIEKPVYIDGSSHFTGFEGGVYRVRYPYMTVWVILGSNHNDRYWVRSQPHYPHASFNDYQTLLKDCLLTLQRQAEQAEAEEQARQERVKLELAEAQLAEEERHQATLLRTTLDSIKTEQAIRKTWQVFTTTRIAGLEERTNLWHQAVQRWNEESLQFSAEMQERIDKVTERQETILALRQAMADRQDSLDAQITALEKQLEDLETPSP